MFRALINGGGSPHAIFVAVLFSGIAIFRTLIVQLRIPCGSRLSPEGGRLFDDYWFIVAAVWQCARWRLLLTDHPTRLVPIFYSHAAPLVGRIVPRIRGVARLDHPVTHWAGPAHSVADPLQIPERR